jgi:hypothetical protein
MWIIWIVVYSAKLCSTKHALTIEFIFAWEKSYCFKRIRNLPLRRPNAFSTTILALLSLLLKLNRSKGMSNVSTYGTIDHRSSGTAASPNM